MPYFRSFNPPPPPLTPHTLPLCTSIAHVNPTFVFDEMIVTHYCGGLRGLVSLVLAALTQQAVAQGYKVVGSMELLGDPLSLVSKASDVAVGESVSLVGQCFSNMQCDTRKLLLTNRHVFAEGASS